MAKRKRLTPPDPALLSERAGHPPPAAGPLTAAAGRAPAIAPAARPAPIADVARDASTAALAGEMAQTLTEARESGRMVLEIDIDRIALDYLVRDRMGLEEGEMGALMASLRARGQQTPVDVAEIAPGRYGLISGWRRCQALRRLHEETGEARFRRVLALQRRPAEASDAYLAMVEENEIRVGLSHYERARIALKAVEQGVFDTERAALRHLYHTASRAKRSKIGSFLTVVRALDGALAFPEALPERAGLRLARALEADAGLAARLRGHLEADRPASPEAEQAALAAALGPGAPPVPPAATARPPALPEGLWLRENPDGSLTLGGAALTDRLRARLRRWLADAS